MKRTVLFHAVAAVCLAAAVTAGAQDGTIALPKGDKTIGVDLVTALKARRSVKEISPERDVPLEDLSKILWAANGVNRADGKRTSPTAYGKQFMNIYVLSDKGVYKYDAANQTLQLVSVSNIKRSVATQSFIVGAPYILVISADYSQFPFHVDVLKRKETAHASAGTVGENVYLMSAALDLGTCIVNSFSEKNLREGLKLKPEESPLYIMPVGYPK